MNVKIICVGKIKEPYLRKLIERCVKELNRSCRLEIIELKDEKHLTEPVRRRRSASGRSRARGS